MSGRTIVIPRRTIGVVFSAALVIVVLAIAVISGALSDVGGPRRSADPATLAAQRAAAELAIGRAYDNATDVLRRSHELKLAITPQQAAAIEAKTVADLKTLRHNALQSVADAYGMRPDEALRYTADAEKRLDASQSGAETGVLLAPRLLAIVIQMDDVALKLSDDAARQLTNPFPSVAPTASPTR